MKIKLTETSVKNLVPPEEGSHVQYDTEIRGFGVRVYATGVKTFVLNYSLNSRERRYIIGSFPGDHSALSARKRAQQLRQMILDGVDPMEQRELEEQAALAERTFAELAEQYLTRHAINKRPASVRDDKSMLNGILLPRFGTKAVSAVTQRDVEIMMRDLKPTPYRANRTRSLLSKMFSCAIDWKWVITNPVRGVPKYPEDQRMVWLSVKQLADLEKALRSYSNQSTANAVRLMMETGSRSGEVKAARWEQFDLNRKTWTKPSTSTKQKREEHLPLSDRVIVSLKKMKPKKEGFIFPSSAEDGHLKDVKWCWQQVCRYAGLATEIKVQGKYRELSRWKPIARVHDLRHSYASNQVSNGVPVAVISRLFGHRQLQTTMRYSHIADEAAREAVDMFGKRRMK